MTSDISVTICAVKKFLFFFLKFIALVLFRFWKKKKEKTMSKKTDPGVSLVSSIIKNEVPGKKGPRHKSLFTDKFLKVFFEAF